MTTDVAQALEVITAALAGMAVLIALLVAAERFVLRPPSPHEAAEPAAAPAATAGSAAVAVDVQVEAAAGA